MQKKPAQNQFSVHRRIYRVHTRSRNPAALNAGLERQLGSRSGAPEGARRARRLERRQPVSSAAVGSARPVNPVSSEGGTYRGDSHEAALCKPDFPKTGGRRSSPARARTMAGRDAAAFIRRRRLIMSLPSPRIGTERTCHPVPPDSRTRRRSTSPTFPASGPRRTAAPPPNHCPRRTRHLSAPWLHARHLAVPPHLPSSAPSSRQPLTFAQMLRTVYVALLGGGSATFRSFSPGVHQCGSLRRCGPTSEPSLQASRNRQSATRRGCHFVV